MEGKEQCTNSSLCWGPGQHLLTANSGPQETTKQNRRIGQRFLNSSNEKSGVRMVHLAGTSWPPTHPVSRAGVHYMHLDHRGCVLMEQHEEHRVALQGWCTKKPYPVLCLTSITSQRILHAYQLIQSKVYTLETVP